MTVKGLTDEDAEIRQMPDDVLSLPVSEKRAAEREVLI